MLTEYTRPAMLWETVLSAARLHADDETFTTLISVARLESYDQRSEQAVVQVPPGTNQTAFMRRAVPALEKAFANVLGVEPRVHVEVSQAAVRKAPADAPMRTNQAVALAPTANAATPAGQAPRQPQLSPKYTFEQFVQGPSNQIALNAAMAVADTPGRHYNPLFIHGNVGLGKTHLLQAICHRVLARSPETRVRYLSCEQFVNEYTDAVRTNEMPEFRRRFRECDMLVVDDIHFLSGKEQTQEEFFHTFNDLRESNRQVVLSSDALPRDIPEMKERLVSRFVSGLPVKIEPPCGETREAIVAAKVSQRGYSFPKEVIQFIAQAVKSNIRELEGAVTQVAAMASLHRVPVSMVVARDALRDAVVFSASRRVSIEDIVAVTCSHFGLKPQELQSQRRTRAVTVPRQIAMYLAREHTQKTLSEIGGYFGNRDRTTVLHSIKKMTTDIARQDDLRQQVSQIERELMIHG